MRLQQQLAVLVVLTFAVAARALPVDDDPETVEDGARLMQNRPANKERFTRFDSNGNGVLSRKELSHGQGSATVVGKEQMSTLLQLLDANNDGGIDFNEFDRVLSFDAETDALGMADGIANDLEEEASEAVSGISCKCPDGLTFTCACPPREKGPKKALPKAPHKNGKGAVPTIDAIKATGPCTLHVGKDSVCMRSGEKYASGTLAERRAYQGGAFCAFENLPDLPISVKRFSTTSQMDSYWCRAAANGVPARRQLQNGKIVQEGLHTLNREKLKECDTYDFVTIEQHIAAGSACSDVRYSGNEGPEGVTPVKGSTMFFYAGAGVNGCSISRGMAKRYMKSVGWEICFRAKMRAPSKPKLPPVRTIGRIAVEGYCKVEDVSSKAGHSVCLSSPHYPKPYRTRVGTGKVTPQRCSMSNLPELPLNVKHFNTVNGYMGRDTLTIDVKSCSSTTIFEGNMAPVGVTPVNGSTMTWLTSQYPPLPGSTIQGWKMCFDNVRMEPVPRPPRIDKITVTGPCSVKTVGDLVCLQSGKFPDSYTQGESCDFRNVPALPIIQQDFDIIAAHDLFVIGDKNKSPYGWDGNLGFQKFSYTGPSGVTPSSTNIHWRSTRKNLQFVRLRKKGFNLCFRASMTTQSPKAKPKSKSVPTIPLIESSGTGCEVKVDAKAKTVCLEANGPAKCKFTEMPALPLKVVRFDIEKNDQLRVVPLEPTSCKPYCPGWRCEGCRRAGRLARFGVGYYAPSGPKGIVPKRGSEIEWYPTSNRRAGSPPWRGVKVCFDAHMPIPAPPAPAPPMPLAKIEVTGGCKTKAKMAGGRVKMCMRNPDYPRGYKNGEKCEFKGIPARVLTVVKFATERNYDQLDIPGVGKFSGSKKAFPRGHLVPKDGSTFTWTSDGSVTGGGFEICV